MGLPYIWTLYQNLVLKYSFVRPLNYSLSLANYVLLYFSLQYLESYILSSQVLECSFNFPTTVPWLFPPLDALLRYEFLKVFYILKV